MYHSGPRRIKRAVGTSNTSSSIISSCVVVKARNPFRTRIKVGGNKGMLCQTLAHKEMPLADCVHGCQQFRSIRFDDIAPRPGTQCFSYDVQRSVFTHKEYFALRAFAADLPCGFDSVHLGEANIKEDQVRLQFVCLLHGFQSVSRLLDKIRTVAFSELRTRKGAPRLEVISDKYTKPRLFQVSPQQDPT